MWFLHWAPIHVFLVWSHKFLLALQNILTLIAWWHMEVLLSCSHTYHSLSLLTASSHWYKPCLPDILHHLCCYHLSMPAASCQHHHYDETQFGAGETSDEWKNQRRLGRRWRQSPKPHSESDPLLWELTSCGLSSAPPEAPDPGADGYPGGWPWGRKGPLADGRRTLRPTGLVWDAAQLKGATGAVIVTMTARNGPHPHVNYCETIGRITMKRCWLNYCFFSWSFVHVELPFTMYCTLITDIKTTLTYGLWLSLGLYFKLVSRCNKLKIWNVNHGVILFQKEFMVQF